MALYGYKANSGVTLPLSDREQSEATDLLQDREAQLANLKQHLAAAQNRMKMLADHHRTDRQFQIGDSVLLKLQPYTQ
jgi:hypothetical protein